MGKLTYRALPNWIGLVRGVLVIAGPAAEVLNRFPRGAPHSFVPPVRPNARAACAIVGADLTVTGAGCLLITSGARVFGGFLPIQSVDIVIVGCSCCRQPTKKILSVKDSLGSARREIFGCIGPTGDFLPYSHGGHPNGKSAVAADKFFAFLPTGHLTWAKK